MDKNIPMEKWKNLYNLAEKFKKISPWKKMGETDIFGVQNPLNHEIGYFTIIGGLGDIFGIIIYTGPEGYDSYLKIMSGEYSPEQPITLMNQKCIAITFDPKDYLEKQDIDLIKELGIKVKAGSLYPVFRNFTPGYYPWFLSSEEIDYATLALEQAIEITNRFEQTPDIFKKTPKKGYYLTRVPEKNKNILIWKDEWLKPEPFKKEYKTDVVIDDIRIQKLKKVIAKSNNIWEIDCFYSNEAVQEEKGKRPYFPRVTTILDHNSKNILNFLLVPPTEKYESKFIDEFISLIELLKIIPKEIHVEKDEQFILLEAVTQRLGIKLKKMKDLKLSHEFRDHMYNSSPEKDLEIIKELAADKNFQKVIENVFPNKNFKDILSELIPGMTPDKDLMEYLMNELNIHQNKSEKKQIKHNTVKYDTNKNPIYQIKITLNNISPPVWRRVLVHRDTNLHELHNIIQYVMGWDRYHLHEYDVNGQSYSEPDADVEYSEDERKVKLGQLGLRENNSFHYIYDFGDDWRHKITLEKKLPIEDDKRYPVCIAGKRACPPEDCGGPWGYTDFLEAIKNPEHEDHEEMMEWVGEDFDPEYFDIDEVNKYLVPKSKKKVKL